MDSVCASAAKAPSTWRKEGSTTCCARACRTPPVDVPVLGPIPVPFALLAAGLAIGFVLARLLALHAGFVGRRWAGRLAAGLRSQVETTIGDEAFAAVDRIEVARRALWVAAREAEAAGR